VIVGYGHAMTYLQRLAVHPEWQGTGMGRSLVRVAARSARTAGAQAMLLNTQFDNTAAIGLYEAEGFVTLPERLALFRSD
jgi:peptide alpha-N-acetyltransferase